MQPTHVKIPRATETTRKCDRYFLRPRDKSQVEEVTSSNDSATATVGSLYMKGSDESHKEVGVRIRGVLTAKHITRVGTYNVRTANSCGKLAQIRIRCKCLTCNQKPTGSQFSLLHELGTCELDIFVRIESRIESAATIRIRIEYRIESGCSRLRVQ